MTEFIELNVLYEASNVIRKVLFPVANILKVECGEDGRAHVYVNNFKTFFNTNDKFYLCLDDYEYVKERLGVQ